MTDDPSGTENTPPALRLIVTTDAAPAGSGDDPTGTQNTPPALRLVAPPDSG